MVIEARDRELGHLRTVEEYMALRMPTTALASCNAIAELGLNLPDEVHAHPLLESLRNDVIKLVIYDNVGIQAFRSSSSHVDL